MKLSDIDRRAITRQEITEAGDLLTVFSAAYFVDGHERHPAGQIINRPATREACAMYDKHAGDGAAYSATCTRLGICVWDDEEPPTPPYPFAVGKWYVLEKSVGFPGDRYPPPLYGPFNTEAEAYAACYDDDSLIVQYKG
jgi:hypothetical protein